MRIINKDETSMERDKLFKGIKEGHLFVHPTDTIYGLGCDATHPEASKKLREIKGHTRPMSIIIPSKSWIFQNCELKKEDEKWLNELPGPYTLIVKIKNKNAVAEDVILDGESIGIRMPDHWITGFVKELGNPIITTSANKHGENYVNEVQNLHEDLKKHIEFAIDEGIISGTPSTIVNLTEKETKVIKRK